MPMSTEKKVGIFFLVALIALGGMIELVEDWRPFEKQHAYFTYFTSAVGIKLGDPVRMAGVEVGKITSIGIDKDKVRIDFYVVDGTVLREDTVAEVRQTNLLGGQFLGVDFGSPGSPPLPPGSEVSSRDGANIDQLITNFDRNQERVFGQLGDLIEQATDPLTDAIRQLESVMRKIDEGEGTMGRLVNDPAMYEEIQKAAESLRIVLVQIEDGEGTLGKLLHDPTLYDDASRMVSNLAEVTDRMEAGEGTLGRLVKDDELYDNANDVLAEIRQLVARANSGEGTLGKLVADDALYDEATGTMRRLNSIATKIDEGEGTLGRLVNEDDLYRDAKTTLHKVEKTVDGLSDSGPLSALGVVLGTLF